ncbi:MAG: hypothetical protein ACE5E4_13505, partial [Candidatus Binatia bacterium]
MTTPKHHKKVTDLFLAACELKPEERAAYLDEACKDDSELRAEVEALLAQDHEHASFLEVAPTLVDEDGSGTTNMDGPAAPAGGLPPDRIPGYEILRKIHGGGQGVVYQAVQIATQRKVAIKILHEGPFASEASRGRFQREIASVAGLDHPNIVKVLDSGVAEGNYFYAM